MRGERDKKWIRLEFAGDPKSRLKSAPPRVRKQRHQLGRGVEELMEPGKRQLRLRFHPPSPTSGRPMRSHAPARVAAKTICRCRPPPAPAARHPARADDPGPSRRAASRPPARSCRNSDLPECPLSPPEHKPSTSRRELDRSRSVVGSRVRIPSSAPIWQKEFCADRLWELSQALAR
jgi:hypothetical protein